MDERAGWGWGLCLAGLAVGFGPVALLYAAALGTGVSRERRQGDLGSAVALVVSSLVVYGWQTLAAWFFSLRVAGRRLALWGFTTPSKAFFWTIPAALAAVYVVSFLHDLVVHPKQQDIIGEFPRTTAGIVLFVILAVVMAPLFEEIFFRGFLFRGFASSWGWVTGACVSAAVFGLAPPAARRLRAAVRPGSGAGLGLQAHRVAVDEHRLPRAVQRALGPRLGADGVG